MLSTARHSPDVLSVSEQLDVVLERIYTSRATLIRTVQYLLMEYRIEAKKGREMSSNVGPAGSNGLTLGRGDSCSIPKPFRTLADLLAESTGNKRGRQLTHYDGIPLSIIQSHRPAAPPTIRRISTPRRIRLNECFDDMKIAHTGPPGHTDKPDLRREYEDSGMDGVSSDEDEAVDGGLDRSRSAGSSSGIGTDDDDSDDDDDDVVFII